MSDQNNICCPCESTQSVKFPLTGVTFDLDTSALPSGGGLSREEIVQLIREELQGMPGGSGVSYSLEEQWTGKYWIDGKKIYQKTVELGNMPNSTTKLVPHGIVNLDRIVDYYGSANNKSNSDLRILLPYPANVAGSIRVNGPNLEIIVTSNYSNYFSAYITIQYTCTDR